MTINQSTTALEPHTPITLTDEPEQRRVRIGILARSELTSQLGFDGLASYQPRFMAPRGVSQEMWLSFVEDVNRCIVDRSVGGWGLGEEDEEETDEDCIDTDEDEDDDEEEDEEDEDEEEYKDRYTEEEDIPIEQAERVDSGISTEDQTPSLCGVEHSRDENMDDCILTDVDDADDSTLERDRALPDMDIPTFEGSLENIFIRHWTRTVTTTQSSPLKLAQTSSDALANVRRRIRARMTIKRWNEKIFPRTSSIRVQLLSFVEARQLTSVFADQTDQIDKTGAQRTRLEEWIASVRDCTVFRTRCQQMRQQRENESACGEHCVIGNIWRALSMVKEEDRVPIPSGWRRYDYERNSHRPYRSQDVLLIEDVGGEDECS
ncbi:hypothetical protein BZA70DRAFT_270981 [Myxozyma melibiosi]|uniref:Uncharacterized protein n=1 Tax=Myxozyma melibiosi TaxID=54550 RepID=A0ABR1FE47_9ASCO